MSKITRSVWKVDLRDPYLGNTIPVKIIIHQDDEGEIFLVRTLTEEGITMDARDITRKEL
jgi:hypothetical protein